MKVQERVIVLIASSVEVHIVKWVLKLFVLHNWSISNKVKLIKDHFSVNNEAYSNWNTREIP